MKNPFLIREIRSKAGKLHFRRWRIIETPWFGVYIHGIYQADQDKDMHDHPWDYASYVIKGGPFLEESMNSLGEKKELENMFPGDFIRRRAEHFHRIVKLESPVYTLFFTGRRRRNWGYAADGNRWVDHETYRNVKNMLRPDYAAFGKQVEAWDEAGIPYGRKELVELAKKYNTPIPGTLSWEREFTAGWESLPENVKETLKISS